MKDIFEKPIEKIKRVKETQITQKKVRKKQQNTKI